jgi:hypothetical protein|tara:strand:- start:9 stop:179 length:171 start_codon:yes stop_codon:yes gene_type:complete
METKSAKIKRIEKEMEDFHKENNKKIEKLLVEEWGFDLKWVKKANKQCERNRKRGK